jgi:hypothetical protein
MAVAKKKIAAKKQKKQDWFELFPWLNEVRIFAEESGAYKIESVTDPKVELLDQYLKMLMDGLQKDEKIMAAFQGSALSAAQFFIHAALTDIAAGKAKKHIPVSFLRVLKERVIEDIELKQQFNFGGLFKQRARLKLKQRGLLT